MLSIGKLAMQLTTPLLLRKPCKLFASVARVCQRQLGFLVPLLCLTRQAFRNYATFGGVQFYELLVQEFLRARNALSIAQLATLQQ